MATHHKRYSELDDVRFSKCIRCGANSQEGLCLKCKDVRFMMNLGREPCKTENCKGVKLGDTDYCRRHQLGSTSFKRLRERYSREEIRERDRGRSHHTSRGSSD